MAAVTGWDRVEVKKRLSEEHWDPWMAWMNAYFPLSSSDRKDWDSKTWVRNLHELRLRDLLLFTLGDLRGKKVLDVGCGGGIYLGIVSKMGAAHIAGQDLSQKDIALARNRFQREGVPADIKLGDATELQFETESFDVVFSADFFEHVTLEQKRKIVSEVYRVLKPGGLFAIKTPNLSYLKFTTALRRVVAAAKLKSPLNIHVPHTRDNPDSEHCGLTTHAELEKLLFDRMFHDPEVIYPPLRWKGAAGFAARFLKGRKRFAEQIILTTRKPLFYGFYPGHD